MKKIMTLIIIVILCLSTFSIVTPQVKADSETIIFQDDFESYSVGSFPSAGGWELVWNGKGTAYQVVTDAFSHSPTKSLRLWGQAGWSANVQREFTSSAEIIGFEAYVRTESNTGSGWKVAAICFWKLDSPVPWGKRFADIGFGPDGQLYTRPVKGSSSYFPLGLSYEADTWYKVRVIIDRTVETYDVWIDDVLIVADVAIWDTHEIDALMMESGHSSIEVYFDNIKVFEGMHACRRIITVDNSDNAETLTDYQVFLNITYDSDMQPDFDDLRFTWYNETSDEEVSIDYWLDKYVDSEYALVWVEVPLIRGLGQEVLYMYYGDPDAVSASNGEETFVFFDGFSTDTTSNYELWYNPNGETNWDPNGWLFVDATTRQPGRASNVHVGHKNALIDATEEKYWLETRGKAFGTGVLDYFGVVKAYEKDPQSEHLLFGLVRATDTTCLQSIWNNAWEFRQFEYGSIPSAKDEWYRIGVGTSPNGTVIGSFCDDDYNKLCTLVDQTTHQDSEWWVDLTGSRGGTEEATLYAHFDYVRVRKFTDPEPSYSIGPCVRRFSPIIDGFQFSNNQFTTRIKKSIEEIEEYFESLPLADEIPSEYWVPFELLIHGLVWMQKGYCFGMVHTAEQYFEHPDQLPPGYTDTHDIPITDSTTLDKIIYNQWITNWLEDDYLLKWLLLRLGNDPGGLIPFNQELEWIMQELDNGNPVELSVFDPTRSVGLDWFITHAVLAYKYSLSGDDITLYVYGPNYGNESFRDYPRGNFPSWYQTQADAGQTIQLTKDVNGDYVIVDWLDPTYGSFIEGMEVTRLGSKEAPTWGLTWATVWLHKDEILWHVIEYVMQETTEYTEILIKWLKNNLKDLWGTLMELKDQMPDLWNEFVDWVIENAKGLWNRIVHFKLHSPADLHVYDSEGMHVGLTATGDLDLEFDALYLLTDELQYCAMLDPEVGSYLVELVGTGEGSYSLDTAVTVGGTTASEQTLSDEITEGEIQIHRAFIPESGETIILDDTPPATLLTIGEPKYTTLTQTYVTKDSPFTLQADDDTGSGVASKAYRIYNATYDSDWTTYIEPFYLVGLSDGVYSVDYNSTDNAGNIEATNTVTVFLDNTEPLVTIVNPPAGWALQDGVNFIASATDDGSGVYYVNFSIREANGGDGTPVGFENLSATYDVITDKWTFFFDTLLLPDGYYVVLVEAEDNLGHKGSTIVPYSIRNWAILELLPATENNKAGRTMPVKFTLRVAAVVDPNQPFVYNEELTIEICDAVNPTQILQESTFGDTARDYRINTITELYITNFRTLKQPMKYTVSVYRGVFLIDDFDFQTVK